MALIKCVLDTNIVVSAHLNRDGFPQRILRLGLARRIQLYVSNEILEEYEEVLRRKKFGIDPKKVNDSLRAIRHAAILVRPKRNLSLSPDPDDNKFLECADAAEVNYLVTGNIRHFPKAFGNTHVVNAREFIEVFALGFQR